MSAFPNNKDKVYMIVSAVAFFSFFAYLHHLDTKINEKKTEWQQEQHSLCLGKENRARPACWREIDWEVYCERVECKGSPRQ
jgi:hypothetical protein